MTSFSIQVPNLQQLGPIVDLEVTIPDALKEALQKEKKPIPNPVRIQAMIDTGATSTVVQKAIIDKLNLRPVGMKRINTPSSTNVECYEYQLKLQFPKNISISVVAIAAPLQNQHISCLIGRDILEHGILIYTGYINQFTLSF